MRESGANALLYEPRCGAFAAAVWLHRSERRPPPLTCKGGWRAVLPATLEKVTRIPALELYLPARALPCARARARHRDQGAGSAGKGGAWRPTALQSGGASVLQLKNRGEKAHGAAVFLCSPSPTRTCLHSCRPASSPARSRVIRRAVTASARVRTSDGNPPPLAQQDKKEQHAHSPRRIGSCPRAIMNCSSSLSSELIYVYIRRYL